MTAPAAGGAASGGLIGLTSTASDSVVGEPVAIDATLHIVAVFKPNATTIHVNTQRSTAIGQTTGKRYQFHVSDKIVLPGPPPTGSGDVGKPSSSMA